jgi:hypothetical protein
MENAPLYYEHRPGTTHKDPQNREKATAGSFLRAKIPPEDSGRKPILCDPCLMGKKPGRVEGMPFGR